MFPIASVARMTTIVFFSMRRCYPIIALFLLCAAAAAEVSEQRPVVVFYRTADCPRCDEFERVALHHPIIQRRLPGVMFRTELTAGRPGVAILDGEGKVRVRWPMIPDTINFGVMLDT